MCAKIRLILRDPRVLTAAGAIGVFAAVIASAISDLVYLQGAGASWLWFMLVDAPGRVFQNNVAAAVAALRTTIWFSDLGTPFPTGRLISICVGLPAAAALALAIATNVNWNDVYDRWEHVRSEVFGDAWDLYSQYLPAGCASWLQAYAHPPERAAGAAGRQTHVVLLSAIWWHALLPRLIDEHLLLITTLVARKAFTTSIPPPPIALDRTWGWFTEACQTSACVAFYFVLGVIVPWDFRLRAMLSRSGVRWWHNAVAATLEWTVTGFAYVLPALAAEGVEFIPAIFLLPLVAAAACALGSVLLVALPIASGRIVRYVDGLFQVGPDWRSLWHRVFAQPAGGAQREVAAIDAADPVQLFMKGPLQAILAGAAEFALACIVELYASKAGQAMAAALIAGTGRADLARYSISGWISVGGEYVTAAVAVVAVVVGIVVSLLTSLRIYAALRALRTLSRVRDIHWLGSPELQWGAVTRTEGHGDNGVETKTTRILTAWDAALQMKDLLGQFQSRDPSDLIDDLGRIVATLRRFLGNHSGGQDKWHESTAVVAVPVAPASDSVRVPGLTFVVQLHRRRPLFLGMSSGELEVEAFAVDARFLCEYHDLSAEDVAEIVVDPFSVPNIAELPVDTQTEDGRVILCISVRIRVRSGPLSRVWRKSFVKTDAQGNINVLETAKSHLALSNPLVGVMGLSSSVRVNWRPEPTAALPIRIPRRWFGQGGGSYDLQLPLRWAAFPLGWWPIDVPLAACWQDISRANGAPSATWRIEILPGSLLSTSSGSAVWGSNILDILLPQDVNAVAEQLPGGFNLPTRLALLQRNVRHAVGSVAPYAQNVIVKRDAVLEKSDRFLARLAAVHFRTRLDCRRPNRDWLPPAGTSDDVVAWYIRNRENEVVFQLVSATAALREIMRDGFEACNGHESIRVVKSGLRGYVLALADCAVRSLLAESIAVDQSGVALAAKPIDLVLFGLSVGTLLVLANTLPEEPGATSRVAAGPLQAVARPGSNGAGDHDPESDAAHSTRTGTFLGATRPGGSITIARAAALDDDTFLVNPLEASVDSDPLRKDALAIAQPVDQRLRPLRPMRRSVAELPAPHDSDATTLDEGSTGASTSASTAALRERASTLGNDADPVTPPPLHGSAENLLAQSSSPTPPNNDDASTRAQSPMDNPQPVTEMGEEVRLQLERVEAAAAARAASQANIMRLQFKVMKEAS